MQTSGLSSSSPPPSSPPPSPRSSAVFVLCEYKTWSLTEAERERSAGENIRSHEAMGDQRHFIIKHSIILTLPNENNCKIITQKSIS